MKNINIKDLELQKRTSFSHCLIVLSSVRQQWEIFLSYSVYYYAAVNCKQPCQCILMIKNDKWWTELILKSLFCLFDYSLSYFNWINVVCSSLLALFVAREEMNQKYIFRRQKECKTSIVFMWNNAKKNIHSLHTRVGYWNWSSGQNFTV